MKDVSFSIMKKNYYSYNNDDKNNTVGSDPANYQLGPSLGREHGKFFLCFCFLFQRFY